MQYKLLIGVSINKFSIQNCPQGVANRHFGVSPSGKAQHFDCCIRWFKSSHPSQLIRAYTVIMDLALKLLLLSMWLVGNGI